MSNLENVKSLREQAKKNKLLQSSTLAAGSNMSLTSSGEKLSDYRIGERVPTPAYYRFTNVGRTTNFKENWATSLLTFNNSSTTLQLRPRGFVQGGLYEPSTQIFKYGGDVSLISEYVEQNLAHYNNRSLYLRSRDAQANAYPQLSTYRDNIHIRTASTSSSNTGFEVKVTIRSRNDGLYLTADATGTGLKWTSSPVGDRSLWYIERVYKVTQVPGLQNGIEFFSAQTMYQMPDVDRWTQYNEMSDGPLDNSWQGGTEFLYGRCFGWDVLDTQLAAGNYSKIYGNMYGALYSGSVYAGKFHTGVDINYYHNAIVKSPVDGTIVRYMNGDSLNTVIIRGTDGFYYNFLHMAPLNLSGVEIGEGTEVIAEETPIGVQSNAGLNVPGSQDSHLHVEVKALNTGATDIPVSSFDYIGNYYPYDIYYAW